VQDKPKILKFSQQQGARSSPAHQGARSRSNDKGAITITAVTKCPCHIDSSASYWTNPRVFSSAVNLINYSAGCAMAGLGKIQYLISNATVGL